MDRHYINSKNAAGEFVQLTEVRAGETIVRADSHADLIAALETIVTICTESNSDCRKRMGTRVGNCLVTAEAALAKARGET